MLIREKYTGDVAIADSRGTENRYLKNVNSKINAKRVV